MTTAYTIRSKTLDTIANNFSYLKVPGPGTYESPLMNPRNGRFSISQFSDSKMAVINRDRRFKQPK